MKKSGPRESKNTSPSYSVDPSELSKEFTGNWVWRTVNALIDTKIFDPSPRWIANKLGVSIEEVVLALEGLEKLGIIQRTETGYRKILKHIYYSDRDMEPKSVLTDHVLISSQLLYQLDPHDIDIDCFYRTGFIASNRDHAKQFYKNLEQLFKEFLEASNCDTSDGVYAICFSGLDISKKNLGR